MVASTVAVQTALAQVPEEFRVAVVLCDLYRVPYADAAQVLEIPVGTVKSRVFRGRSALADRLGDPTEPPPPAPHSEWSTPREPTPDPQRPKGRDQRAAGVNRSVPERPDHPDHEQLAAFEAGDGDRRERAGVAAHLAGCPSCAEVVASVGRVRSRLALLEEPTSPPGLHDRLAAAGSRGGPADRRPPGVAGPNGGRRRSVPTRRGARLRRPAAEERLPPDPLVPPPRGLGRGRRPPPRRPGPPPPRPARRRPHHRQRRRRRPDMAQGQPPPAGSPCSASRARSRRQRSSPGWPPTARPRRPSTPPPPAPPAARPPPATAPAAPAPQTQAQDGDEAYRSSAPAPQAAATADLQPCLPAAAAAADPATRPLVPAFYLQGTYQGRPATVLVTTSNGQPGRVDLWVFPRDNCSPPPLATERVREPRRPKGKKKKKKKKSSEHPQMKNPTGGEANAPGPWPRAGSGEGGGGGRYQTPLARAKATPPLST